MLQCLIRFSTLKFNQTRWTEQVETSCRNRKMFGHETIFKGVWSPNMLLSTFEQNVKLKSLYRESNITGGPSSQYQPLYCFFCFCLFVCLFFLTFHVNVQRKVTWGILTWLSPCSICRCCVTTVWSFEFIKVCMGTQRFCWKSQFCLHFVNKIYLPCTCCCVVFFVVCLLLRPI